ncbi:MAG: T9SS type A sorting domain-containing protein, partial [Hymenobacteraceae bacterium]|nr:T9SS type A sorting domain-containing protein [Hymenobacteraceae bacterium]MDX5396424.1 T9SS type A sorting domain-containing protein [Hymenobacteraceae bacterium]MDX5442162.1 T9SS type A sorting domain-containing protein [Hymenobacteraceae bacterium]MDX5512485.1 T9SS type A sorting domain-containing protein [Hymenobacteraceae bacterium]
DNEIVVLGSGANDGQVGPQNAPRYQVFNLDSLGQLRWHKLHHYFTCGYQYGNSLIKYSSSNFLIYGNNNCNTANIYLVKTDAAGDTIATRQIIDPPNGYYCTDGSIFQATDGNLIVSCMMRKRSSTTFKDVSYIIKLDTALNILWQTEYEDPVANHLLASKIKELPNGNILLVTNVVWSPVITLVTLSPQGQVLDTAKVTTNKNFLGHLKDLHLLGDSIIYYVGHSNSTNQTKGYLAKINIKPFVTSVKAPLVKEQYYLSQCYPNPATAETTIGYKLPVHTKVAELVIQDMVTGRTLKTVALLEQSGEAVVSMQHFPAGMYTYSLIADGKVVATKKMAVIK